MIGILACESAVCLLFGLVDARDFAFDPSVVVGTAFWMIAASCNLVAAWTIWYRQQWWLRATVFAQTFVGVLAIYVLLSVARDQPLAAPIDVVAVASLVLAVFITVVAIHILLVLLPAIGNLSIVGKSLIALIPLVAIFQLWLQSVYLPSNSPPLIDVSATLTNAGHTGGIIHLKATVTVHNRGTVEAEVLSSFATVTSPQSTGAAPKPDQVAKSLDWNGDDDRGYRPSPKQLGTASLDFADTLSGLGSVVQAGETSSVTFLVDVDRQNGHSAEISAYMDLATKRRISNFHTCPEWDRSSVDISSEGFRSAADRPIKSLVGGEFLCTESDIAPQNAVADLLEKRSADQTYVILSDPTDHLSTFPYEVDAYDQIGQFSLNDPAAQIRQAQLVQNQNPGIEVVAIDNFVWSSS